MPHTRLKKSGNSKCFLEKKRWKECERWKGTNYYSSMSILMVRIRDYNHVSKNLSEYSSEYHYISNLINSHEFTVYESMTPCISVKNYLDKSSAQSVCICENYRPVGLITKQHMDAAMSGK